MQSLLDQARQQYEAGRLAEAEIAYRQALVAQPNHPEILHLLGIVISRLGRPREGVEFFQRAIAVDPHQPAYFYNLGNAQHAMRNLDQAIAAYQQALQMRPDSADVCNALGNALIDAGKIEDAEKIFRRATEMQPDNADGFYNLARVLRFDKKSDDALKAAQRAIALRPDHAESYVILGNIYKDLGQLDECLFAYTRAGDLRPDDPAFAGNRLYTLHFHPDYDAAKILREHRVWDQRFAQPLSRQITPHTNDRDPDRRLRIGYVSPDFRQHPVGLAIEPVIANHDRREFEVFCFSNSPLVDAVTNRIRSAADDWHPIFGMPDEKVANLIRELKIDILVDLSLHMAHNRLLVFARKPAPVQVTYLGYPSTTGLSAMDFRLSDPWLDPAPSTGSGQEGTDEFYSEKTIRLPRTYLCWKWGGGDEPEGELPSLSRGVVTFGSLNNFCKVTPRVLETWGKILSRVKNSRLILRCPPGSASQRVRDTLARHRISADRIDLIGRLPWKEYVDLFRRQDIGLDPFPYPGHTTSLDGLWMGVPVVTLPGSTAASRGGASILQNLGLPELIAKDEEDYVAIAVKLAGDAKQLAQLRKSLRGRIRASSLMDEKGFAREIESAYRHMWRSESV
jgi:protein O-GlcNAc transferase